ncbi:putative ATP-dependent RNA helicase TDRD12 isoform X2 [Dreissena polymorpha]|uniref:putative ATP-dependent RNA helicase TDRD12 isoform X2 n=1 Tax=Dreissena polymorpha TaxID=45954 RepID=UPI0022655FE6|nr:putative ATP-dependent RNA helicase TDRD12 isoform X2 [Dreissena polymorpha]
MELEKSKIFGQMQGQKILEKLGHGIEKNKSAMLQNSDRVSTKFQTTDHVLIHGGPRPRPSITIHGSRFNPDIITAFEQYGFAAPTIVQAYSWPIVRKGRHLVMISPSGTGKTLAYLYPLLDYLSVPERYREIRKNGMGAFVIILTLTWENAEKVHYEITKHEECNKGLTTLLVHGGGMEEKKLCELINGCDILISTPPCLKRIIMKKCTNLRRLCHLVLDDADQLLERFRKEISFLIEDYNMVISSEMEQYSCPRQILAFSSHWNHSIEEFMKNALNEPVLVITSHSEAAIYGKVKHVPHMCRHDNRLQTVVNIVENLPGANNSSNSSKHVKEKTIIFSSSKSDLFLVFHALKSLSHYCMMVHPDMDLDQALQVAQQTNLPLLVCTDKYVSEMRISDATCVIHFDIPNSKTEFSNRLGCMRDYFQDFSRPKKHPVQTVSHLIITEECRNQARNLNELLVRSNSPQSMELQDFMAGIIQAREENEGRDLCNQVLAYGTCRDKWRCKFRHIVVPEVDIEPNSDWIPNEGEVKVLVTHIIDASHYYARILGVRRREGGQLEDMSARFSDLQLSLGQWFSKLTNQKRHTTPFIGEVCGYQENNIFFRVQILDLMDMNCHEKGAATMEAKVRFVDIGREAVVEAFKLYELPEHLKSVPHQAVEVFVGRVKPVDKDIKWTHTASKFAHEELHRKELEGKIVLCVGYRLWLDPLVLRFRLTETRVFVNKFAVHTALIKKGLADENRNHLERLFRLVEGKVHIPKALMVKTKMSQQLYTDVLPACKPTHQVIISAVRSPELFFVQRLEKMDDLETLMTEIGDYVEYQAEHDSLQEVTVGKIYLAQYTEFDQRWYRGRVVNVENACVEIFFADYGDSDTVPLDKIRAMPVDKFYELPLQAIECKLANVEPNGPDPWHDKVGNAIWEMSHFVNERDSRPLTARVIDSQNSVAAYMGDKKFALDITCGQSNIGEELVWRQLAKPALNSTAFQPLLSKPSLVYRMYKSMLHKIPDLCSALYWEQEPSKAMKIADEILGILGKHLPSLATSQEPTAVEGARFLTKLVGRLGWANVHSVILDCVLYCVRAADSLCTVLLEEGLVKLTVSCLEMNSEQVFQHQAADFIAKACSISSRLRSCYVDMHMDVLYELLDSTSCEHVQGGVCRAFTSLCSGPDDRAFVFLMSPGRGTIQRIVGILSRSTDHLVAESVLSLISTLTEIESNEDQRRNHDDLKKESLIEAIVKNLRMTDCDKCIQYSVQLCDHFASKHRKRKRFLMEQEMVPILNGLLDLQLQSSTRQLCRDLKTSLEVRVPSEPMRAFNRPDTQPKQAATNNVITPEVRWSQNSFVVRLVIKVSDADDGSSDVVQFSDDTVTLRVATNTGNFGFSYKLYDKICISKCKVAVRSQDLLVSMTKEKKGMWSRLIHDKVKMPNVLLDCDNIVDSSDSEECNEDEPFKLTKGKKQKSFSCGLARKTLSIPDPQDSETDTTDSLEILEDHDRTEYDFDDIAYQNL